MRANVPVRLLGFTACIEQYADETERLQQFRGVLMAFPTIRTESPIFCAAP